MRYQIRYYPYEIKGYVALVCESYSEPSQDSSGSQVPATRALEEDDPQNSIYLAV